MAIEKIKSFLHDKIIKNPFFWAIIILILIRTVFFILILNNIPPINAFSQGGWFIHGGDGDGYFKVGQYLLAWDFIPNSQPLGFPLFYAPIISLFQASEIAEIIVLMLFLHGVIFYSLVTILVYYLAKEFLSRRYKAIIIAFVFVIYPYLFYLFFQFFAANNDIMQSFIMTRFMQLMFFHLGSDPLSAILTLSSIILLLKLYKDREQKVILPIILGLITSWAVITRLQNAILLPVYPVIILYLRKFKTLFYFIISMIPLGLFQAYANWRSNGSIFKTVYNKEWETAMGASAISIKYPLKIFEYALNYVPVLLLPIALFIILIIFGTYKIIKEKGGEGIILACYFFSILFFISLLAPTFLNPRYFLPIIPVMIILVYAGIEQIILIFKKSYGKL